MIRYFVYDAEYDRDHAGHALYQAAERYDPEAVERIRDNDPRIDMRWPFKRPVAISWMTIREEDGLLVPGEINTAGQPEMEEAEMLSSFFKAVSALPSNAQMVTWGGNSSDEPQIRLAALRLGMPLPPRLLVPFEPGKRYGAGHVDLMNHMCGEAARVHLAELCASLRIPAKTIARPTATASLIAQRKWSQVKAICEHDVLSTAGVLLHAVAPRHREDTLVGMLHRVARLGASQSHRPYADHFAAWAHDMEREQSVRFLDELAKLTAD